MRRLRRRRSRQDDWQTDADEDQALSALDQLPDEDLYGDYDDTPIEPFVPVEDDDYELYEYEAQLETASPAREPRRRVRFPRPQLRSRLLTSGSGLRWDYLLLALILIGGGIFGALLNQDRLQGSRLEFAQP